MLTNLFMGVSVVLFILLCFMWSNKGWLNLFFKMVFFFQAVFGVYLLIRR